MTAPFATLSSILEDLAGLPERFTAQERHEEDAMIDVEVQPATKGANNDE